ncbi:MAG: NAD-binding protein [Cyanobacteria bacterium]|nr:NAD-binding protein [Cyanobacteriota bacterium]
MGRSRDGIMLIEYDLVIIGATELGCRMALRARQLGARVALVEQGEHPETTIAWRHWLACDSTKLGSELAAQLDAIAISDECKPLTPEALQIQGVDYLAATGTWSEQPKSAIQVGDRLLHSSSYVATLTPNRRIPVALWGLPCKRPEDFVTRESVPDRVAIFGDAIVGVELAVALRSRGSTVTLIVPTPQILPQVDPDGAIQIQMVLEASGIQVLTKTRVESAQTVGFIKYLTLCSPLQGQSVHAPQILEVDEIVLATPFERLDPDRLGLRSLGPKSLRSHRLRLVGSANRSRHRVIPIDGLTANCDSIALTEVQAILQPWKSTRSVSAGRLTHPPSFWIGPVPLKSDRLVSIAGQTAPGNLWYNLKMNRNGQLVNATLTGELATQLAPLLSVAIQTKISLPRLLTVPLSNPAHSQVISKWIEQWEQTVRSRQPLRHELFLDWLGIRRRSV